MIHFLTLIVYPHHPMSRFAINVFVGPSKPSFEKDVYKRLFKIYQDLPKENQNPSTIQLLPTHRIRVLPQKIIVGFTIENTTSLAA